MKSSKIYIISFFQKLFKKRNIGTIIYLLINTCLIIWFVDLLYTMKFKNEYHVLISILIGISLYFISLCIALSPFGEWILRKKNGCEKITRQEYHDYLMPLFNEVHEKAMQENDDIPKDVKLFINGSRDPNAFATGRKTICVTEGLMRLSENEIKAVLAHEMGHLANKDTDALLLITVGNLIFGILYTIIQFVVLLILAIGDSFMSSGKTRHYTLFGYYETEDNDDSGFLTILGLIVMWLFNFIWTKVGTLLVMKTSRNSEYEADKFSYDLGYGYHLCKFLDRCPSDNTKGVFAVLAKSHPSKNKRIAKLQEYGCDYSNENFISKY